MLGGETVQILTAGAASDPYSGEPGGATDWSTATSAVVTGVLVEPRPSGEPTQDARNSVVSGYTLYLPAGTAVTADNRVRVRGVDYDVLGEPAVWRLGSWEPGIVVQVERTAG